MKTKCLSVLVLGCVLFLVGCTLNVSEKKESNANTNNGNKSETATSEDKKKEVTVSTGDGGVKVSKDGKEVTVSTGDGGVTVTKKGSDSDTDEEAETGGDGKIVIGNAEDRTIKCDGKDVSIGGSNSIKLLGRCKSLTIFGGSNEVEAETVEKIRVVGGDNEVSVKATASISITGSGNKVYWSKGLDGKNPSVSKVGTDNTVSQR